jgi:hypothetical protein
MIIPGSGFGKWTLTVFVNGLIADGKSQYYPPHGSLADLKPHDVVSIEGQVYYGIGVAYIVPNQFVVQ